jgi:hypothetical protein
MNEFDEKDNDVIIDNIKRYEEDMELINLRTDFMTKKRNEIHNFSDVMLKLINTANSVMFKNIVQKNEVACKIVFKRTEKRYGGGDDYVYESKYQLIATPYGFRVLTGGRKNSNEMGLIEYKAFILDKADEIELWLKNKDVKFQTRFKEFKTALADLYVVLESQGYLTQRSEADRNYYYGLESNYPLMWKREVSELKKELTEPFQIDLINKDLGYKKAKIFGFVWKEGYNYPSVEYEENGNKTSIQFTTSTNDFRLFSFRFLTSRMSQFQDEVVAFQEQILDKQKNVADGFKNKLARYLLLGMI